MKHSEEIEVSLLDTGDPIQRNKSDTMLAFTFTLYMSHAHESFSLNRIVFSISILLRIVYIYILFSFLFIYFCCFLSSLLLHFFLFPLLLFDFRITLYCSIPSVSQVFRKSKLQVREHSCKF